ncbi:unnamed protein product [Ectocarpus sp. 4 AP-2014]|uniref:EsV-1-34 n=1 Tax=Ectocarpus siliculosus virus 1 (isolate New Zealand/Kaikoura/1988) TaxID=654926 RepID=Q8QNM9_ESV1K|nr:EsV-1-34 [Ectocarpus siliculosus virus 1]AAK14460.1 EsV-1-34 [Ectocarpus siliculosus virus 1]
MNNMADAVLGVKGPRVDKKSVSYVVAGCFCVYALVYKIPIPCFGCQKNGFWYRCVMDTGDGTASCAAHKAAKSRVETAGRIMDEAGVYMDNLWDFTKTELPGVISDFIATLKDQVLGLKDRMAEKINLIIAFLRDKIELFWSKIKNVAVSTYEKFMEVVINPVIKFFVANLLKPAIVVFEKNMEFRDLIWSVLSNAVDKFANIPIGDFVGDVVDVFQKIPEAMDNLKGLLVMLINKIKNDTIGVVNTGIRESIQGVETSVNFLSGKLDDGVNSAVGGLNHVKDELVGNLNKSINGMAFGLETAVNTYTGGIETVINKSVGGITDGINNNMNKVEKGVGKVMETTNDVIKGAEIAVNTISCGINNALNKVEDGVNNVTKGVTSAVNKVLVPVNATVGIMEKVRNVKVPVIKKRIFSWIKTPGKVRDINIDGVELPTIPVEKFGRIKEGLNIPNIPFKNIDIPALDIPTVNIKAPADIKEIDIPDINIPSVAIPIPRDVREEDFDLPSIPGFGFITDKVEKVKESIREIFETAMAPLYDGLATLIALVGSIISSAKHFFYNYLTWTAIKSRVTQLMGLAGEGVSLLKDLFVNEIVPAFMKLIRGMADPILAFVKAATDHTWRFMKKLGANVGSIFNKSYKVITKVTGVIAKGVFHTGLYIIGTTVERYTGFIPLPLSVKLMLIMASIIWMFFGGFLSNGKVIVDLSLSVIQGAAVALTDLDHQLDLGFGVIEKATPAASSFFMH